jgi:2-amino-4-hydroxy-6-hydroxymethyldihydropteridine diphosphokinase
VIRQDIYENQANKVFLAIGSNLGDRFRNIELAKMMLSDNKIKILKSSSFYETLSWPNIKNPKFLNVVLEIETNLRPLSLLDLCKKIEKSLGRKKSKKNSPRVCDIDILDYAKRNENNGINLPHPRLHQRNFVLIPLFEISKKWTHPKSKDHIKTLILKLSKKDITSIKQI